MNNIEALSFIKKYGRREGSKITSSGLIFDKEKPKDLKFPHANFDQMWHQDIEKFFELSDEDKLLYAYSAQRRKSQEGVRMGTIFGLLLAWLLLGIYSLF
jgi:hypothetical protein